MKLSQTPYQDELQRDLESLILELIKKTKESKNGK